MYDERYRADRPIQFTRGDMVAVSGDSNRASRYVIIGVDDWQEPPIAHLSECGTGFSKSIDVDRLKLVNA